jgi:serine-type D-Ala-D-Ala carboxypeptidase (penicillin-binding protein 5/6)
VATTVQRQVVSAGPAHRRWPVVGALVVVLLLLVGLRRVTTEGTPPLLVHRTLSAYVRLPGSAPALAWPEEGQAAVEVEGVGSLGSVGGSAPVPIASVAKVMTAYLTLREHPLAAGQEGFSVTITVADAIEEEQREALGESTLNVRAGERLSERQALQALLLPSANNVAALLARYDAGGIAPFVARMNATARTLGMGSSTYTDPSGFNDETVSTAADQLKLARAAMRIPVFAEIVDEPSVVLPVVGRVANYNGLVGEDGYVGVKTGSDRAAGGCLVFAKKVLINGRALTVLGVVLNQRGGSLIQAALVSARQLGDSAAASLRLRTALRAGTVVLSATSVDGRRTNAITAGALRAIGWGGERVAVHVVARPAMTRLKAGEKMARVALPGVGVARTSALARSSVGGPSLGWRLRHLF